MSKIKLSRNELRKLIHEIKLVPPEVEKPVSTKRKSAAQLRNEMNWDEILNDITPVLTKAMMDWFIANPVSAAIPVETATEKALDHRGFLMETFLRTLYDYLLNYWIQEVDDALDGWGETVNDFAAEFEAELETGPEPAGPKLVK